MDGDGQTFKIRHVYGDAVIGPGAGDALIPGTNDIIVIPKSIDAVDWDEPKASPRWFETETLWYLPVIQVWTYERHGGRLRGTFSGMMDAFDFARGLLERHDQVHVSGFEWRVILDARGEHRLGLPVMRIEFDEKIIDNRARVEYFGATDLPWRGFYGVDWGGE